MMHITFQVRYKKIYKLEKWKIFFVLKYSSLCLHWIVKKKKKLLLLYYEQYFALNWRWVMVILYKKKCFLKNSTNILCGFVYEK